MEYISFDETPPDIQQIRWEFLASFHAIPKDQLQYILTRCLELSFSTIILDGQQFCEKVLLNRETHVNMTVLANFLDYARLHLGDGSFSRPCYYSDEPCEVPTLARCQNHRQCAFMTHTLHSYDPGERWSPCFWPRPISGEKGPELWFSSAQHIWIEEEAQLKAPFRSLSSSASSDPKSELQPPGDPLPVSESIQGSMKGSIEGSIEGSTEGGSIQGRIDAALSSMARNNGDHAAVEKLCARLSLPFPADGRRCREYLSRLDDSIPALYSCGLYSYGLNSDDLYSLVCTLQVRRLYPGRITSRAPRGAVANSMFPVVLCDDGAQRI